MSQPSKEYCIQSVANSQLYGTAPKMLEALKLVLRDRDAGCLRQDTCEHIESVIKEALGR